MYVKDCMQAIIITVSPHDTLSVARQMMDDLYIRHLPVVHEGKLVGIVTDRDLRQASSPSQGHAMDRPYGDGCHGMRVSDMMTQQLYIVSPDTALVEAAATLLEQKIDGLPVVDEAGVLKGLLTVTDFVRVYMSNSMTASSSDPARPCFNASSPQVLSIF